MSITSELRDWVSNHYSGWPSKQAEGFAIADRIDAEHERAIDAMWEDAKSHISDYSMAEHGYVRLPKDADGEYIHVGDVMESRTGLNLFPKFEVRAMRYDEDRWEVIDRLGDRYEPSGLRHYHAPTVEDVLREFAEKITDSQIPNVHPTYEEAIAEYAAKLRLAEGEDE